MKKLLSLLCLSLFFIACEDIVLEDDITDETVVLLAPANDAQFYSTSITFTWDPIENGSQYRIQIAWPNFENPMQIVSDQVVDTTSFTTQLNLGQYQWRVQGINSSYSTAFSTRSFTVVSNEDFQNNSVALQSPSDNSLTNVPVQNFSWQSVLGATGYHIQIINTDDNSLVTEQDVTSISYNYTFATDGSFLWKVRATNGQQNTLYATRTIAIDSTPPNTPVLTAPANQSNSSSNEVTFQWTREPIAGSTEKDSIYIFNDSNLTDLEYENEESSPYTTTSLSDGTYYWYVKSFDAAGNTSQQSSVFSFTLN
jgi:hypothetical protein